MHCLGYFDLAQKTLHPPLDNPLARGCHPCLRYVVLAMCPGRIMRRDGGAGGIRTLDRALQPYNGLANRRLQPLGHSSGKADMPDAGASRKRQMSAAAVVSH